MAREGKLVGRAYIDIQLNTFCLYPAGAAAGYCILLVSFFLLSFFSLPAMPQAFVSYEFLSSSSSSSSGNMSFSHTSLHPILTKLGQSDQYLDHYSGTNNDGVRGHDGITGVKN